MPSMVKPNTKLKPMKMRMLFKRSPAARSGKVDAREVQERGERAGDAEHRARSARTHDVGMPEQARGAATEAAQNVEQ